MKFSVLMSVYYKDNVFFLNAAIESIYISQILKPDQVVIVCDGPLSIKHHDILNYWKNKYPLIFNIHYLPSNLGLANALNFGISFCKFDYIARMDSDDISSPSRFQKQIQFLSTNPNLVFFGSNVAEFNTNYEKYICLKKVPLSNLDIIKYSKFRNPFNHMSVFFKKSYILDLGGYRNILGYEDYDLWVRLLQKNYLCANMQEVLVFARIGNNMVNRRRGIMLFKNDMKLQILFYKLNYINIFELFRNIIIRCIPRLMPVFLVKYIYKILRF